MSKAEDGTDKDSFELPEGVNRGGDYFGLSVGARKERSAARLRARMPEEKANLLIIYLSHEKFLSLPPLATAEFGGIPIWMPRYDEITGAIVTNRWSIPKTEITKDKRSLPNPEKYKILRIPSYRANVDLSSLPKSWTVVRLLPQEVWGGIEAALMQQDEVRHDYGIEPGVEQELVEELLVNSQVISDIFRSERVTHTKLNILGESVEKILNKHGFAKVTGEVKMRINSSLSRAVQEDSIGRINPLIARTLLMLAYLNATKREVQVRLAREKANKVYEILYIVRAFTRASIENAILILDVWGGFGKEQGAELFVHPEKFTTKNTLPDGRITHFRKMLHKVVQGSLDRVKVAPYLLPATLSKFFLLSMSSFKPKERIRIQNILREGGFFIEHDVRRGITYTGKDDIREFYSLEDCIRRRNPKLAAVRLFQARQILAACLEDEDNKVYTVF